LKNRLLMPWIDDILAITDANVSWEIKDQLKKRLSDIILDRIACPSSSVELNLDRVRRLNRPISSLMRLTVSELGHRNRSA